MDIALLKELIPLLAAYNVQSIKHGDVELQFWSPFKDLDSPTKPPEPPQVQGSVPDFMNDETMSMDKILNWSGSPEQGDEPALPMTGDAPLSGGEA